jgi:hypothetical protein
MDKQLGWIQYHQAGLGGQASNGNAPPVPGKSTRSEHLVAHDPPGARSAAASAGRRAPVQAHGARRAIGLPPRVDRIRALFGHPAARGVR